MRDVFIKRLSELAELDDRIMLITGDLGFGVFDDYTLRFPKQFINAGVAEQNMTGLATGLALEGHVVFTYSIANFSTLRCLEQIRNDACYHGANVNVVSIGGGFSYGALGISHHATEDLSIMRALPDLTVVAPSDDYETEEATTALVNSPGASYLRLDKSTPGRVGPQDGYELGKARVVCEGSDVTFVVAGGIMEEVLVAAGELESRGISCRILSMHTITPLDVEALELASQETHAMVVVEEHTVVGGLGGAVAENLMELLVRPKIFRRIGLRAGFSSIVGSQKYLRARYGMDAAAISKVAIEAIYS